MYKNNRKIKKNTKGNKRSDYKSKSSLYVTTLQKPIFGFIQPRILSTLKYNTPVNLSNAATAGSSFKFKINSLFDPEDPVGGHQPYGFDTVANIYSRYTVIRVGYDIEFCGTNDRLLVGIIFSSQSPTSVTTNATYQLAAESPFSYSKALSYTGGRPARFTGSVTINELLGITPGQLIADDQFTAAVTADPSQLAYMMLYSYNPTATNPVVTTANVNLFYEAVLFDPFLQNQS